MFGVQYKKKLSNNLERLPEFCRLDEPDLHERFFDDVVPVHFEVQKLVGGIRPDRGNEKGLN